MSLCLCCRQPLSMYDADTRCHEQASTVPCPCECGQYVPASDIEWPNSGCLVRRAKFAPGIKNNHRGTTGYKRALTFMHNHRQRCDDLRYEVVRRINASAYKPTAPTMPSTTTTTRTVSAAASSPTAVGLLSGQHLLSLLLRSIHPTPCLLLTLLLLVLTKQPLQHYNKALLALG